MIIATIVGVAGLVAFIGSTWGTELPLFWAKEGFRPKPLHITLVIGLFAMLVAMIYLLAATLDAVKEEHVADIARQRAESTPPKVEDTPPAMSPLEATIKAYELRGFTQRGTLDVDGAPQIWAKEAEPDDAHIFRRAGTLIYQDGTATQFSVAVIFQDDVWALGDEVNVQRGGVGRAVTIRTALNRPTIRELIQANDYVLGVGLASSSPSPTEGRNENLAHARGTNIAVAIVHKLKLKDSEHAMGASLGYALGPPTTAAFEPRQRAVVLIGINASRDVEVDQVMLAAAQLITVQGVDLSNYQHAGESVVRTASAAGFTDYRKATDFGETAVTDERWTLPAVRQ